MPADLALNVNMSDALGTPNSKSAVEGQKPSISQPGASQSPSDGAKPGTPAIGSDRFAALARQERQLQQRREEVMRAQTEANTKLAKIKEFEESRSKAALNPLKALESLGLTYEQITNFVLNGQKPADTDVASQALREVEALRQESKLAEERRTQEAKSQRETALKQARADYQGELAEFIKANGETYELSALHDPSAETVMEVVDEFYKRNNKVLNTKEAVEMVEKYLEGLFEQTANLKKFKGKQAPKDVQSGSSNETALPTEAGFRPATKPTLTNELTSTAPSLLPSKTENDRIARALAALAR